MEKPSLVTFIISFIDFRNPPIDMCAMFDFLPFEPSTVWNKGEKIKLKKKKSLGCYNNSTWKYQKTFEFTHNVLFEDMLIPFLSQILPFKGKLISLKHKQMEFDLSVFYSQEDLHDGFVFNREILSLLLELQIDLSIYPKSRGLFVVDEIL